jgi:hypothetical protein
MSTTRRFRTTTLGLAAVFSAVLLTPVRAQETDLTLTLARVSAVEVHRAVAAQQALQDGDLGSMQEEALLAVVARTSLEETHGEDSVTERRVFTAQQALASADLGSMQEEALTALVVGSRK